MEIKKALITGITGQDGSYLAEFLLKKGYEVHGIVRRVALEDPAHRLGRINHILDQITLHPGSMESYTRLTEIIEKIKPDEVYHLAAQSFVHESFEDSFTTFLVNVDGTLHIISAVLNKAPNAKFYFAGSSEMFGRVVETPQTEKTPFRPRSPYGITKVTGFHLTRNFREAYNLYACSGILFNHESPRRGFEFVTRKITSTIADMKKRKTNVLVLGNLEAKRDWGFAKDYIEGMWLILQQEKPDDYVLATGESHSVKEFVDEAFRIVDLEYELVDLSKLSPEEANRKVVDLKNQKNKNFVIQHPSFYRPAEVNQLQGDYSKAQDKLNWKPQTKFKELVKMMVEEDLRRGEPPQNSN
jgi:GDPmannose 4,6-dehydratase